MPGFHVFVSNRLEILVEQLAQIVRTPLSSALLPEVIVVQSRGMERWVSMELADQLGVWANCTFPFPNAFLQGIFKAFMPELPEHSPWDPQVMAFTIMDILSDCINRPDFHKLRMYLKDDFNHLKLFQLSNKIADLFDQYTIFRPELILAWDKGRTGIEPGDLWQALLWQKLVEMHGPNHKSQLRKKLLGMLATESIGTKYPNERVSVFGISYLPTYHLETFAALAKHIPVNFFLLNPCQEYWMDIVSEKRLGQIQKKNPQSEDLATDLHFEEGNRLLASLGGHGRDFFNILDRYNYELNEFFIEQPRSDMLSYLQADILALRNRGPADLLHRARVPLKTSQMKAVQVADLDTSVQVHNCHSPMREIEVLHNSLLAMFDEDPALLPKDIIVMAPDIETYAPIVQAVFDAQIDKQLRIPYSIADHNTGKENRLIDGFLALLDLKDSRLGSSRVLRLLEFSSIRQNFGLSEADIPTIEKWIRDTQIRWGKNQKDRSKFGLPPFADNSWQSGMERLLLGFAMPGNNRQLFHTILPYDHIEGAETMILGKFIEFIERVFRCLKLLEQSRSLKHWQNTLAFLLEQFFISDDETERDRHCLKAIFNELGRVQSLSGFSSEIEFDVVYSYLSRQLEKMDAGSGFMSRGVTFCAMLPMRSIPFKVICLIGMNAEDFPRDFQPISFDLAAMHPKPGDRSKRNDDKYLFLESIISARKVLYLSYTGQSILDNSRIPPSVLVSELLDTIEKGFFLPAENILQHVIFEHRLQPFSSSYFQPDSKLFSYSKEDLLARIAATKRREPLPFIEKRLPLPPAEVQKWRSIGIDDLCSFFTNPAKFLLQKRLGVYLESGAPVAEDRENFELDPLAKHFIEQNILKARLSGIDLNDFRSIQRATGELPPGNMGDLLYSDMSRAADGFANKLEPYIQNKIPDPVDVDMTISDFNLRGRLAEVYEQGCILSRYADCKAKDILKSWIYHLIYCDRELLQRPPVSFLICKNRTIEFTPVSSGREILGTLLKLFLQGLSAPLHFFPESSYHYACQIQKNPDSPAQALLLAEKRWSGSQYQWGEASDPYYQLCYSRTNPIDSSFEKIAKTIFMPIFKHWKEKE
jgi:exodeoxyribonuclease V gamma subunit